MDEDDSLQETNDLPPSYVPAHPYDGARALQSGLPNLIVAPPNLDYQSGVPVFNVKHAGYAYYRDDRYGDPAFVRDLAVTRLVRLESQMLSWDFDKRRTAQPILPFLYLGASATARDATFLSATGITFLLAVRSSYAVAARPKYLDPATYPTTGNRNTATFDVDTPFDFITKVKPAIKSVVDYLEANTTKPLISANDINAKILVYCESGNDRSAAFVVAFLMVVYCLDAATAVQLVQSQRYCIYIEDGFKRMLMDFDQILQAERQVVSAHMQAGQGSSPYQQSNQAPTTTKRAFAAYSGDGEMGGCVDSVEDSRLGMAPFADA